VREVIGVRLELQDEGVDEEEEDQGESQVVEEGSMNLMWLPPRSSNLSQMQRQLPHLQQLTQEQLLLPVPPHHQCPQLPFLPARLVVP